MHSIALRYSSKSLVDFKCNQHVLTIEFECDRWMNRQWLVSTGIDQQQSTFQIESSSNRWPFTSHQSTKFTLFVNWCLLIILVDRWRYGCESVELQLWASIIIFKFWATPSLTIIIYTFKQINLSNLQFFFRDFKFRIFEFEFIQTTKSFIILHIHFIINPCKMWIKFFLDCNCLYWKLARRKSPISTITHYPLSSIIIIIIGQQALDFTKKSDLKIRSDFSKM